MSRVLGVQARGAAIFEILCGALPGQRKTVFNNPACEVAEKDGSQTTVVFIDMRNPKASQELNEFLAHATMPDGVQDSDLFEEERGRLQRFAHQEDSARRKAHIYFFVQNSGDDLRHSPLQMAALGQLKGHLVITESGDCYTSSWSSGEDDLKPLEKMLVSTYKGHLKQSLEMKFRLPVPA